MIHFRYTLSFLALTISLVCAAQNTPNWSESSDDYSQFGSMIAKDNQGNIIATGYRPSYIINAYIYTYKYDINGTLIWSAQSSSNVPNTYEKSTWVNIDSQDNVYVTGYRYAGTTTVSTTDIIIIKYNSTGEFQWKKIIPHPLLGGLPLRSELDSEGNLYIGTIGVDTGFNLYKINPNGEEEFVATDNTANNYSFSSMRLLNDLVVMTGPAMNGFSASIAAFSTSGEYLWSHQLETHGAPDLEISPDQHIFVLSRKPNQVSVSSDYDVRIIEFDNQGEELNSFAYDFEEANEFPSRMTLVNNRITIIGPIIPSGQAYMDWMIFQIDLSGNLLWSATHNEMLSNDEKPYWVTALPSGDVYVSGQGGPGFTDFNGSVYMQYVVIRYSQGEIVWSNTNVYQGYIGTVSVLDDNCGLYVLGETATTINHYNDDCDTPNGLSNYENNSEKVLSVFPNPASHNITISIKNNFDNTAILQIFDMYGKLVYHDNSTFAGEIAIKSIQLPTLSSGIYQITFGSLTEKLVIE